MVTVLSFCESRCLNGLLSNWSQGRKKEMEFILADIAIHQWSHYKWRMRFAPSGLNQAYRVEFYLMLELERTVKFTWLNFPHFSDKEAESQKMNWPWWMKVTLTRGRVLLFTLLFIPLKSGLGFYYYYFSLWIIKIFCPIYSEFWHEFFFKPLLDHLYLI